MLVVSVSQWVVCAVVVIVAGVLVSPVFASGRLEGRITQLDGTGLSGVSVLVNETSASTLTDPSGRFVVEGLPAGTFSITFTLGDQVLTIPDVQIANETVQLDRAVDWKGTYAETVTVYAASRRNERLFDAPASIAVVDQSTLARDAPLAQVPRALLSTTGVEVVQSGVFDFNVNIRGLNSALSRRVVTLFDGRDPSSVLIGGQEWAAVALPMDEIARIEVVRGPGSALYGANAFNGVIDMTSKEPRYTQGGNLQFSAGNIQTRRFSVRHAGALKANWFYRAHGTYGRTRDFFQGRTSSVEYPGLPSEVAEPSKDRTEFANAGARADRYFATGRRLTLEGGWARADGSVVLTGAGRIQNQDVSRPWLRSSWHTSNWRVSGYYDARKARMQSLTTGNTIVDDSLRLHGEAQRRFELRAGSLIVGGAHRYERADTTDGGVSTILRGIRDASETAVYGQFDRELTAQLRVVLAARLDAGTLHDPLLSPRLGLVFGITPTQTLRAAYAQAFQTASFVHYYTRVAAAPPVNLAALEQALAPALGDVPLGFASVPILALGNDQLVPERNDSFEAGYSGVVGRRLLIGADYYHNKITNMITGLLPQVGTSLGRINPQFGAYRPPSALNTGQQALVLGSLRAALPASLFAVMSNDLDGAPIFAAVSYTNFARATVQGAELSALYHASDRVTADVGFSLLDFALKEGAPEDPISANAPPRRVTAGLMYADARKNAGVRYRRSAEFNWIGGIFRGPVPGHSVVDLSAGYALPWRTRVSLNITNVFDNEHYEIFGGDILQRTALLTFFRDW